MSLWEKLEETSDLFFFCFFCFFEYDGKVKYGNPYRALIQREAVTESLWS